MHVQRCPNCRERNDVSVYVHGQLARCVRCNLRFTVDRERPDSQPADARSSAPETVATEHPTDVSSLLEEPAGPVVVQEPSAVPLPSPVETAAQRPGVKNKPAHLQGQAVPQIPGYECLQLLGRGGMGEVWKARQLSLDRIVAIKILSPSLAVEPDFVRRFERESSALATLAHPHVVQVFDRGSANGHWYFVMEYVEGRSLRDRAAEGMLTKEELLRLVAQTARAVDYAHARGVIHRDLKPENILVDHVGHAKVADFGLAGMSEHGRSSLTMTAVAMGTAHYMAPEQRRDAKNVDGRADLYSIGVMLYELVTNELPVGRFATPKEKVPDTDPRLDNMILSLLDQDPARRPSRASEVAELLETIVARSPLPAPEEEEKEEAPVRAPERIVARREQEPGGLQSFVRNATASPKTKLLAVGALAVFAAIVTVSVVSTKPPVSRPNIPAQVVPGPDKGASVTLGEGDPLAIRTVGDGWDFDGEALVRDSGQRPERPPRALLEVVSLDVEDAAVEANVELDEPTRGLAAEPPLAEVLLYANKDNHLGLRLTLAEDAGFRFFSTPAAKKGGKYATQVELPRPEAKTSYHLSVFLSQRHATAFVDGRQVASASLTRLEGPLRAAFGCVGKCRFTNVKLRGPLPDAPATARAE